MPERIAELRDKGHRFVDRLPRGMNARENALLEAPEGTWLLLTTGAALKQAAGLQRAVATISKPSTTSSATWIAPPATLNGTMPNSVWRRRNVPRAVNVPPASARSNGTSMRRVTPFERHVGVRDRVLPGTAQRTRAYGHVGKLRRIEYFGAQQVLLRTLARGLRHRAFEISTAAARAAGSSTTSELTGTLSSKPESAGVGPRQAKPDSSLGRDHVIVAELRHWPAAIDADR